MNGTAFTTWLTDVDQPMPHLPWAMFAYLEAAWLYLTRFSTNHINVNIYRHARPVTDLDVTNLHQALIVVSSCNTYFCTLFATGTADKNVLHLCPTQHKFSGEKHAIVAHVQVENHNNNDSAPVCHAPAAPAQKKKKRQVLKADSEVCPY